MSTETTGAPATRSAAALMREAFEAIDAQDLESLARLWDEHSTDVFVALDLRVAGERALRDFFGEMFTAVPDLVFEIEAIHEVSEDIAVGQWQMSGTFSGGPFQGIEPTGKRVELRGIDVMQFEHGILRHNDVYYDGLSFARQVGMLPPADSVGDKAMTSVFNALTRTRRAVRERFSA